VHIYAFLGIRLGRWLSQLSRFEELMEFLQPLCERFFEQVTKHEFDPAANGDESPNEHILTSPECHDMLRPAYVS
jgi:hypothetical protein